MKPTLNFQGQHTDPEAFFQRYMRAASALRAAGVGEGDVVAMMMRNGPSVLEVMLATRWIGALWCPINWHFKTDEVQYILIDSGVMVFIADADLLHGLPGLKLDGIARLQPLLAAPLLAPLPANDDPQTWQCHPASAPADRPANRRLR